MEGNWRKKDDKLGRDSESERVFAQRRGDLPDASAVAFMMVGIEERANGFFCFLNK